MVRAFQNDLLNPHRFLIALELVPGRESFGQSVDTVKGMAADSVADGRISAVSITDNPGGNPSLSPDVIGHEVFKLGMDVMVHFACRDMNRSGMESRALQLAMMGMKNILALTGDYTGRGFGGRGAPVFDLDSVNLLILLRKLSERIVASGNPDGFFGGVAVSPFKYTDGGIHRSFETVAQILDRLVEIQDDWREYVKDFGFSPAGGFYAFPSSRQDHEPPLYGRGDHPLSWTERALYRSMETVHHWFFNLQSPPLAPHLEKAFRALDRHVHQTSARFTEWCLSDGCPRSGVPAKREEHSPR